MTEYKLIKDLKVGMNEVDITLNIDFFGDAKRSRSGLRFSRGLLNDGEGGEVQFTVFGEDCDKVKKAKKIKITNGYVKEWDGMLQLGTSKEHPLEFLK